MPKYFFLLLSAVGSLLLMGSCEGIFEDLYDTPPATASDGFGFIETNAAIKSGTIYIDVTSYQRWTYISLKNKTTDTSNIVMGEEAPAVWDFALHRYDVCTNGGAAFETSYSTLDEVRSGGIPAGAVFTADTLSQVVIDMSHMMDGYLDYDTCMVNPVLSRWLDVDLSSMPPVYAPSLRPYLLRLYDGSYAALFFANFMDEASVKGYVTIKYIYPL